ncbi:glycoside hydrolase family 43 protein [Actinoplanes sp. G11-F43]|uniref:glycoside hydrolase family 43 protein n=1 Tax=Actinoplanes sp. G11-F43 TaxID=3424130 RepID=UPI003D3353D2
MTIATSATGVRTIRNPVLPGFHPDPSILRVGSDYFIATSTFEWYPGVRLHHSTDLVRWRPLGGALTERRLLDLTGTDDSCGVWAPNLTWANGLFHLLYTDVATFSGGYWDPRNHLITAPSITGPWSEPVALHGRGFDASLFHDEDGTSWMLSMRADWRPGRNRFAGIEIQQYDPRERRLVGPDGHLIFEGTGAGFTEAPNVYRKDGWYYLITAEGGTSWEHRVTVARSRHLLGGYEVDPSGPLLTSAGRPDLALQKAGHGSLVQTPAGDWYLAHLVARPYAPSGRCVLGRETALQRLEWQPGEWPRVPGGVPAEQVAAPDREPRGESADGPEERAAAGYPRRETGNRNGHAKAGGGGSRDQAGGGDGWAEAGDSDRRDQAGGRHGWAEGGSTVRSVAGEGRDDFDGPELGPEWSTLRRPAGPEWIDLSSRPSHLRIRGGQSPMARQRPSLVARRVTAARCTFEAAVDFEPRSFRELAGVTAYYNTRNWYFPHVTAEDDGSPVLGVLTCDSGRVTAVPGTRVPLGGQAGAGAGGDGGPDRRVGLRIRLDGPSLTFAYRIGDGSWNDLGGTFDATTLSDEYAATIVPGEPEAWGFTGAFVGLWVQDLGAEGCHADFDHATYRTDPTER